MESPNRNVIVNEDDNRKLEIYTQGDLDASPSGVGIFACDPTTTMRILRTDDDGNLNTNPIQEDTLLLRKIVKLLESNAVVDIQNRQKITIDGITNGLGALLGVSLTGAASLLATTNYPTNLAPIQQPSTSSWQPVWIGPVDQRFQIMDAARMTYDNAIRSHLSFT